MSDEETGREAAQLVAAWDAEDALAPPFEPSPGQFYSGARALDIDKPCDLSDKEPPFKAHEDELKHIRSDMHEQSCQINLLCTLVSKLHREIVFLSAKNGVTPKHVKKFEAEAKVHLDTEWRANYDEFWGD